MTTIFNGKDFAERKLLDLHKKVLDLNTKGIFPHLSSIIIGNNKASELYVSLKKKRGEKIGIQVDIYRMPEKTSKEELFHLIDTLNEDAGVTGIMIQLPIPGELSKFKDEILERISEEKDVDGLRKDSKFKHPTAKAVMDILDYALSNDKDHKVITNVCVVGAKGMVGRSVVKLLKDEGFNVMEGDVETKDLKEKTLSADVVISAVGSMNLITPEMIKDKAIIIDVGSPFGDFEREVEGKSSFFTPVPGGVGPVTISALLENLTLTSFN